jgi:hypothetical protein
MFISGYDQKNGLNEWRIEKRATSDGASLWGGALATQDTPVTLAYPHFRLRMLMHVVSGALPASSTFALEFAPLSGSCGSSSYSYVTASTPVAYYDNPTPGYLAPSVINVNDPAHSGDTVLPEVYSDVTGFGFLNPLAINAGQDGEWDFSLTNNGMVSGQTYCLRMERLGHVPFDSYSQYAQVQTP